MKKNNQKQKNLNQEQKTEPRNKIKKNLNQKILYIWYFSIGVVVFLILVPKTPSSLMLSSLGFFWSISLWFICFHIYEKMFYKENPKKSQKTKNKKNKKQLNLGGLVLLKWLVLGVGAYGVWRLSKGDPVSLELGAVMLGALLGFLLFVGVVWWQQKNTNLGGDEGWS